MASRNGFTCCFMSLSDTRLSIESNIQLLLGHLLQLYIFRKTQGNAHTGIDQLVNFISGDGFASILHDPQE